jgi:2-polyprenyl-6-methoxyphenol hydroxylase-like FAD-dependent oxidoreductase
MSGILPFPPDFDAVVIGAGPAGAVVGRLLASWAHSVRILGKAPDRSRGLAESLPPSTRKLLAEVGVLDAVDRAGFYRTTGNTVWWASAEPRVEPFDPSGHLTGYQVFRPDLDRVLLDSAKDAGAVVCEGATVRRVRVDDDPFAVVEYEDGGHRSTVTCRFVLDCSGRAGVLGQRGARFLLVGDAGSFIDPLSSFGVKKALASAWVGAIVVHTCLTHPDRQPAALDFFSRWERDVYATHLRRSRDFARAAQARHPHPFWARRADTEVNGSPPFDEAEVLQDPDVRSAFETLKERPALDLALDGQMRLIAEPVIRGREIVLEDAVPIEPAGARTAAPPRAIRFLGHVDLVGLAQMSGDHRQVPDLFEAYCRTFPPVPLPALLAGLAFLVAKGILKPRV